MILSEQIKKIEYSQGPHSYDAAPVSKEIIDRAYEVAKRYQSLCELFKLRWEDPKVSTDDIGNVVFDWAKHNKALSLYITRGYVYYIKAWGPSVLEDMSDDYVNDDADAVKILSWIFE